MFSSCILGVSCGSCLHVYTEYNNNVCRVEDGGLFSDKKSEGEEEEEKGKAKTKVSFIVEMTCIV